MGSVKIRVSFEMPVLLLLYGRGSLSGSITAGCGLHSGEAKGTIRLLQVCERLKTTTEIGKRRRSLERAEASRTVRELLCICLVPYPAHQPSISEGS